jgi:hypothetical protein
MASLSEVVVHNPICECQCLICLDTDITVKNIIFSCNCNSAFHRACFDEWYKKSGSCPICRVKIPVQVLEDVPLVVAAPVENITIKDCFILFAGTISILAAVSMPVALLYLLFSNK